MCRKKWNQNFAYLFLVVTKVTRNRNSQATSIPRRQVADSKFSYKFNVCLDYAKCVHILNKREMNFKTSPHRPW